MKPALSLFLAVILVLTLFTGCTAENTGISAKRIFDIDHPNDDYNIINASFTIPDIPNVIFTFDRTTLTANGEKLSDAFGCSAIYTADVTGDGVPELCLNTALGSGITDFRIVIIDYTTRQTIFSLIGRMQNNYYFFVRNGVLCVKEVPYRKEEVSRTGILVNSEGDITVVWDEKPNAQPDMDEAALLPVNLDSQTALKTANGNRLIDIYHPDDSEKNQFFTITTDAFPDVVFTNATENGVYANNKHIVGDIQNRCISLYLADLTGDGAPELCFGISRFGFDDKRIIIYDYTAKKEIFSFGDYNDANHYLFLRDGILCVKEVGYNSDEITRTGMLTYGENCITIVWEKEINAQVDRD